MKKRSLRKIAKKRFNFQLSILRIKRNENEKPDYEKTKANLLHDLHKMKVELEKVFRRYSDILCMYLNFLTFFVFN